MMELIVLGAYGPYPTAQTATSGYLLNVGESSYLFDMGSGVYSRLLAHLSDLNRLKAIFLTHLHDDHIADFSVFKYAAAFKTQRGLLTQLPVVYHPMSPMEQAENLKRGSLFEHIAMGHDVVYSDENVTIRFTPMQHPVETYGVRVEAEGKVFAYTSDTSYYEDLQHFVVGTDLLLITCGYLNKDKPEKPNHMTCSEVATVVSKGHVKRALATHFLPENAMDNIQEELERYDVKVLSLAEENKVYQVE